MFTLRTQTTPNNVPKNYKKAVLSQR